MNTCFESFCGLNHPRAREEKAGTAGSAQPQDGGGVSSLSRRRCEVAGARVVIPPPSTSAKDSAEPPLLLGVGALADGPAVAPAAAPRSQVAGHEPPIPEARRAGETRRNGLSLGSGGRGETRPLVSRPGEGSGQLWASRTPGPGLRTGRGSPPSQAAPGSPFQGRGWLCRKKGTGRGVGVQRIERGTHVGSRVPPWNAVKR